MVYGKCGPEKKEPLVHRPTRLAAGERYSDLLSPGARAHPSSFQRPLFGDSSSILPSPSHSAKNAPLLVCCFNEEQREFHTQILDALTQTSVLHDFPVVRVSSASTLWTILSGAPSRVIPLNTHPPPFFYFPIDLTLLGTSH